LDCATDRVLNVLRRLAGLLMDPKVRGRRVLVRTAAPEVALQAWVPFRYFPKVAHVFVH
jgi:hypothetical protein